MGREPSGLNPGSASRSYPQYTPGNRPPSTGPGSVTIGDLYLVIISLDPTGISLDPTGRGRQRWSNRWKGALAAFGGRLSAGRETS